MLRRRSVLGATVVVVLLQLLGAAAKGKKAAAGGTCYACDNVNFGATPCSGSGTYKSLVDIVCSASGQSTASADLATKLTDYSVQEIDWAKSVVGGTCKPTPTCNNPKARADGVKGRKDVSKKICGQSGAALAAAWSGWSLSELGKQQKTLCKK
mmetsp:Transcript_22371/g.88819  ORF Transcript_22371/g.88819 Transcript_22371/m.88819 type:complete len:154 (+) Transcript_22371:98-559(+)